eukprot:CAMPEP_0115875958 /NCGR_PEP_ID=MMETSP0287-20121206/25391_1 /TAXON_ID=412157 /ORGANISM="Chrysochromulina rotalis, Strain UIO044" /LENGTH=198 /DNA_ID=CAMNT_0003331289 /DNA_START=19 /DNA_END=615 /DNA_ORIENTATION=+
MAHTGGCLCRRPSSPSTHDDVRAFISRQGMRTALWRALHHPGARALDVGAGSGYMTACLALLAAMGGGGTDAIVVALELNDELAEAAGRAARAAVEQTQLDSAAELICVAAGDGHRGHLPHAPYDAIHVGASCPKVPHALTAQLRPGGGSLLLCVGAADEPQALTLVERVDDGRMPGQLKLQTTVLHEGSMMYGLRSV